MLRNVIAILLVLSIVNVTGSKAIHEFFEHHFEEHTCEHKDITHFHEFEIHHVDIICNFNFSTSIFSDIIVGLDDVVCSQTDQIKIRFLWLVGKLYHSKISLRGPPFK